MQGVYKITNPVGAIYVGSSVNIERRWKQYKYLRNNEQHKLRNSILKYGLENHVFEVLCECEFEKLLEMELHYSLLYNVIDRSNLNLRLPVKSDIKYTYSKELRDKISSIHKGKTISEEQKKQISMFHKGKKQTPEHIEKRKMFGEKNPMYGKSVRKGIKLTKEQCEKMSIDRIGKYKLGDNGNAKKIINIKTGEIYNSAKEVINIVGLKYTTFLAQLQGRNRNSTDFEYLINFNKKQQNGTII